MCKKYLVDNLKLGQEFYVYAETEAGAFEKAIRVLLGEKAEHLIVFLTPPDMVMFLMNRGWLVYDYGYIKALEDGKGGDENDKE